jgi:hypothetical protein
MNVLATSRTLIAAAALIGASSLAQAETVWQCWRDQSLHIVCVLAQTTPLAENEALPPVLPPQPVSGPAMGGLPAIVKVLHEQPAALRGQYVRIPLHSEPTDASFVAELAQSVMCGNHLDCQAKYSEFAMRSLDLAMATADAIDPLTTMR